MIAITVLFAILSGIIQGITGFGAGIVMMMVLPFFYALPQAAGISAAILIVLNIQMLIIYRKNIRWKRVFIPAFIYIFFSSIAIHFSTMVNQSILKVLFGIFLVALCMYYLQQKNPSGKPFNTPKAFLCIVFSGLCSGLFGIGGPLMMLYFIRKSENTPEYLGTIQGFFLITNTYNTFFRIQSGILTLSQTGLIACCSAGIIIGGFIAHKVVGKLNRQTFMKCVYSMLGVSGIINIVGVLL